MEKENKRLAYCSSESLELDLSSCWKESEAGSGHQTSRPVKAILLSKSSDIKIKNRLSDCFKKYNIIAYGFCNDNLNIDVVFLLNGYACLCRAETITNNAKDITIFLVSNEKPKALMQQLTDAEFEVEKISQGIYHFQYMFNFQIIVSKELPEKEYKWLTALTNN